MSKKNNQTSRLTLLILFLMTLAQMATDIYLPSFPAIKAALQTTHTLVQLTFSVFLAGFAVSQLIYGPFSDKFGRKPFLLFGVSLYCLTSAIASITHTITMLLIVRVLQGIGAGACSVIPRAIMQDRFTGLELEKITLYQSMTWSLIPISAPLLGSYIQHYLGWRFNFIFLVIISLIALILVIRFKETIKIKENKLTIMKTASLYRQILFHRYFSNLVCAMGIVSIFAAFNVTAPILLQEILHLSPLQYGWSIFGVAISYLIGTLINRLLMGNGWRSNNIASMGVGLLIIASLLLVTCALFMNFSLWRLLAPFMILLIGSAFVFPNNSTKALQYFPNNAGKAAAVFGCGLFVGSTITSSIIAVLPARSLMPLAWVISIITAFILIAHIYNLRHE